MSYADPHGDEYIIRAERHAAEDSRRDYEADYWEAKLEWLPERTNNKEIDHED